MLAKLRPTAFAALLALGAQLAVVPLATAQIVAYKPAPASQRPTVLSAGNGVPLINIQTPSAAGVSRNTYSQFDVDAQGAILNNSRNNVQTQLGGWVQGNPWLARGTARVILNEVISANPSQLLGYVEIAGSKAEVVIANPAGVTCNGCGFINASRATLTTGTPIMNGGALEGYRVEGGTLRIEGAGMDASRVAYSDLIARAVEINAGIWAQNLAVTAGTNTVNAANTQATPIAPAPGSGAAPAFAIDVASLGGMYAGKIVLVGTEAGVGVRNAGHLGASAGEVRVTVDGRLENSGSVIAAGNIDAAARTGIANAGSLYAGGNLALTTAGDIESRGADTLIAAGGNATLAATGTASRIVGDAQSLFAAGLASTGMLGSSGNLDLAAAHIETPGRQLAGGDIRIAADSLALAGSSNSARNLAFVASVGDIDLAGSENLATGTLTVRTTQTLRHADAKSNAGQLDLAAHTLDNRRGELVQTGAGDTAIALPGTLDNRQGRIASNSRNLALAAPTLDNADGRIEHAGTGTLAIGTDTLAGARGRIASNGALVLNAAALTLDAAETVAEYFAISAGSFSHAGGQLLQRGTGASSIAVTAGFDNRNATLAGNGSLAIAADTLDNRNARIAVAEDLALTATRIDNASGQLAAGRDLGATLAGDLANAAGSVAAGRNLALAAASFDNQGGTLGAIAGTLTASFSNAADNRSGRIEAGAALTLAANGLDNSGGTLLGNTLAVNTRGRALANDGGRIVAEGAMNLHSGALTNSAGLLRAGGPLSIDTHGQALANAGGFIGAAGALDLAADTLGNSAGGNIVSETAITAAVRALDNGGGRIETSGDLALTASEHADNRSGLLRSGQALNLKAASLDNRNTLGSDQGIEGHALGIAATTLDNRSGALRADTRLAIESSGTIDNRGGLVSSAETVVVEDAGASKTLAINSVGGTFIAGQQLAINAASLTGGSLLSHRDLALALTGNFDNGEALKAARNASVGVGGTLANSGILQAGNALTVSAGSLDNRAGGEILAPELRLAATATHTLTNRGLIDGGDTRIDAITLNNLGTGRLYGDHLAIAASTLNNHAEGSDAPVIAARDRLDLGVTTLSNRDGALIFSAGDIAIGGTLDANHRATGQAGTITNSSATIEALGNLDVAAGLIDNRRSTFAVDQVVISSTPINVVLWDKGGGGNYKLTKNTNVQISETRVTADSGAGRLLAGGDMRLAGSIANDKSDIMAGGNIQFDLAGYTATSQTGQTLKSETGYTTLHYRKKCSWYEFCSYKNHRTTSTPYNDGPYTLGTFDVAVARLTANQAITGTATHIDNLNVGGINQSAAGAGAANAQSGPAAVSRITQVTIPGTGSGTPGVIATVNAPGSVPNNALFHTNPGSSAHYLVETDPKFANYRQWISSDYMLKALALDPATTQKRLGDGFYEQRLLTEQIASLTGRRFLAGYQNEEDQYKALMNAGVAFAKEWKLIPGVALSAEQMARLTTDMVWLVEKEVTLADGSTQKVLAPQLYARVQQGDLAPTGGLLAANSITLDISGDLVNMGTIAGRSIVSLDADNLKNLAGRITGEDIRLTARNDLDNLGGAIAAGDSLLARAGRNLTVESAAETHSGGNTHARIESTAITRLASLHVKNPGGTLQLEAGGDIALIAAHLLNTAPTAAGPASTTTLIAGGDIKLATVTESTAGGLMLDSHNYRRQSERIETGTVIESTSDIRLVAGQDIAARAASITSSEGAVIASGRDIALTAGEAHSSSETASRSTKQGFLSSKTKTTRDTQSDTTAIATTLSGDSVTLLADRDIQVKGSNVAATHDTALIAGRNLSIEAAAESHTETHYSKTKQSGLFGSGGVGFTLGSKQNSTDQQSEATTAAKSTVGSVEGNVTLLAGEQYRQVGSDVIAAKGDIDIAAKTVDIVEARETSRTTIEQKSKQSGFTVAFTNPVITAVQTAQQMASAAKDTSDPRMKALAAASTGLAGYNAGKAVMDSQGKTVELPDGTVKDNQIPVLDEKGEVADYRDATAADKMGGVGINLSIGGSKSSSKTTQTSDTAAVSNLTAGRDIRIEASGAGSESDILLQGTNATAARNLTLTAEDEIRLLAARNTFEQHSSNKNSSASLGIGFMVGGTQNGFTIQAGVSGGKGRADGQDISHSNTHVEAGQTLTLQSGGDTLLRGAVARGEQVKADIGKDLKIESLQDTSTYDSKQKSAGVSVSLCIPPFCYGAPSSGSISASGSKVKSDYASVTEQSAIRAGDGGFDVKVNNDTDLKGGAITSTQQAIDDKLNRFETGGQLTTSDIENKAEYTAKSASINIGTGFSAAGALVPQGTSAGFGKDSDSASSTTQAAISGIAGNKEARTGDKETGIAKIFDQEKVQKEIEAQTKITQMFGQLAPKAAADFAGKQAAELKAQGKPEEAKQWEEGGAYRVALHTVIGGMAGGASGALGAGASAAAAPLLNDMQESIAKALKDAGANDKVAKLAGQLIAGTTAAGIGAAVGGSQGAVTAFNTDANNRQLHPTEARLIKDNAAKYAARRGISIERAEAELTQQAMQQTDSAWDERLGADNKQAQAFLREIGTGTPLTDLQTGQRYQLFSADQATRDNHAMFAQYAKADPQVRRELDLAMSEAYRPKDGQTLDRRGMSGSDMALNDAARDYGNMKSQPADVQWAVLRELRQTRQQNQQVIAQLAKEYSNLPLSPESTQRRGELQTQIETLQQRDQALLGSIKAQLLDMGSGGSGLLIPGKYREWTEGFGEARSLAGLNFKGMSHAGIGAKIDMLKGVVQEIKAVAEAERAAQRAVDNARIDGNIRRDDAQQYEHNNAPIDVPETVTRRDNDFVATVNHKGNPKAHTDADGNLVAANPEGTGSVQSHVRGSNPENTPFISTTDPKLTNAPKNYGQNQVEINTRDLQRDINSGRVQQEVEIIPPQSVQAELQSKLDAAQAKFDRNPSPANEKGLLKAQEDLANAVRDGECLIKGCVPAPYIHWPNGVPQVPKKPSP